MLFSFNHNMDDTKWNQKNNPMMSQGITQTLVSLNEVKQGTEDFEDSLIVQSSEEVIDSDIALSHQSNEDNMSVPLPDNLSNTETNTNSGKKRKSGKKSKRVSSNSKPAKKWEHKSVKIKTLEGEFSASMWTSGIVKYKNYFYDGGLVHCLLLLNLQALGIPQI